MKSLSVIQPILAISKASKLTMLEKFNILSVLMGAVLINRLRIGHTRLTHSYLLSGDDQPVCSAPRSLLSTFSLNVLILLLSVAGILVLFQ